MKSLYFERATYMLDTVNDVSMSFCSWNLTVKMSLNTVRTSRGLLETLSQVKERSLCCFRAKCTTKCSGDWMPFSAAKIVDVVYNMTPKGWQCEFDTLLAVVHYYCYCLPSSTRHCAAIPLRHVESRCWHFVSKSSPLVDLQSTHGPPVTSCHRRGAVARLSRSETLE